MSLAQTRSAHSLPAAAPNHAQTYNTGVSAPVSKSRKLPDASTGGSANMPPRKRTKEHSCDSCRRRKLKCDRGWPCGACRDRNEEHLCTWEEGVVPERAGRDAPDNMMLLQRMASLESKFEQLIERIDTVTSPKKEAPPPAKQPVDPPSEQTEWNTHHVTNVSSMLSMFLQPTDVHQRRRVLLCMLHHMPPAPLLDGIFDSFRHEVQCINGILDKAYLQSCMSDIVLLQDALREKSDFFNQLCLSDLSRYIYSVAVSLSICATVVVFSRDAQLNAFQGSMDSLPLYQRYIREALLGLSALPVFDEPNLNFVIIMVLVLSCLSFSRLPGIASGIISHAVQVAFLLDLDMEPPESMSYEEAYRRVQLYFVLCAHDWFSTMAIKRYPLIPNDKERLPSLFGSAEQRSKYLSPYQQMKLKLAHLFCRSSPLIIPQKENYAYIRQLHDEALEVQSSMPNIWLDPHNSTMSTLCAKMHRMFGEGALHYLLLRIHLQYYMRGWDDETYALSRDTCYASARSLLRLFREAFSWKIRNEGCGNACESFVPDEISVPARMWYFSHWCTAAALLLLKHVTMLNERNGHTSWNHERESTVEELCIMSRLFQYLSPVLSYAREGYDAMQRVASHALQKDIDIAQLSNTNCVTHWADRIMPHRTHAPSSEPMSVLNTLSKRNEFSSVADSTSQASSTPSISSHSCSSLENATTGMSSAQQSPNFRAPSNTSSVSGRSSDSNMEFDTFWAKFAAPQVVDNTAATGSQQDMPYPVLPEPSMFLMQSHQAPIPVDADMALMLQQKDLLDTDPLSSNVGSLTPFADDFLRSLDNIPPTLDSNASAPLPIL